MDAKNRPFYHILWFQVIYQVCVKITRNLSDMKTKENKADFETF